MTGDFIFKTDADFARGLDAEDPHNTFADIGVIVRQIREIIDTREYDTIPRRRKPVS